MCPDFPTNHHYQAETNMTRIAAHSGSRFIFARKRPHRISTAVITAGLRGFFTEVMFVFEMPKVVHIRNPALGLLFRLVQLSILTYFVIFVMWWNKGYQSFDRALSGVTAKVSGVSWVGSDRFTPGGPLVDNGAYNLRSLQNSGVYLTTRITAKAIQQLGYCAELTSLPDAHCLTDAHCTPGTTAGHSIYGPDGRMFSIEDIDLNDDGHGVFTGRCLQAMQVCEIYGWCPVRAENQTSLGRVASSSRVITPINILMEPYTFFTDLEFIQRHRSAWEPSNLKLVPPFFDVLNYTLFIRNAIEFPYFDVKRRNILQWMTEDYLHSCMYDPVSPLNQYCPVFRVYDMLRLAGANPDRMIYFGGVIAITIDWTCDLDWSVEHCLPQYAFRQLDYNPDVNQSQLIKGAGLAEGSHQELTIHFGHDGQNGTGRYRLLLNSHGIAFLIRVTGQAGKFNLLSFTMRFGSGLALLSGATIMCDLIAFHFMRDRELFREVTCDDKTLRRLLSMSTTTGSRRVQLKRRNAFHIKHRTNQLRSVKENQGQSLNTPALLPLITLSTTSFSPVKPQSDHTDYKPIEPTHNSLTESRLHQTLPVANEPQTSGRVSLSSYGSSVSQYCYPTGLNDIINSPMYESCHTDNSSITLIGLDNLTTNNM